MGDVILTITKIPRSGKGVEEHDKLIRISTQCRKNQKMIQAPGKVSEMDMPEKIIHFVTMQIEL